MAGFDNDQVYGSSLRLDSASASVDAFTQLQINSVDKVIAGVDATDDSYRIAIGSALGTSDALIIDANGQVTKPLVSRFLARTANTLSQNGVTGNGTDYTVIYNVELYDLNSDYNTSTGVFTAPVDGVYALFGQISYNNLDDTSDSGNLSIVTSLTTFRILAANSGAIRTDPGTANGVAIGGSAVVQLDAMDTAYMEISIDGMAADDVNINVGAQVKFGGYLVG